MATDTTTYANGLHSLGPAMPGMFDFTSLFEASFLSILPSTVLLLVLPFRLRALRKQSRKVSQSLLHGNKLVLLAILTAFHAAVLVLYATNPTVATPTTLAATSLVFADALGLLFLSHAEHLRSVRPSVIINTYLFVTLLFDVARIRTLWIGHAPKPLAAVFTASTAVKLLVAIAEAVEKRRILLSQYQRSSPEVTGGIYNRSFFWWLNQLMKTGFRQIIRNRDLFPIDDAMSSSVLRSRAQTSWNAANKSRSHALFWSTLKASSRQAAICIFPRLCLMAFRYAQPFLLSRTVTFVSSPDDSDNIGWGLTAAFGLVFLGLAVSTGSYYHMTYRLSTTVRGSLVSMIYAKTVDLSLIALDESAAITLMSNDAETICQGLQNIHELWAVPIELGLAIWLLQRQLGLVFLAPAAVAVISTACTIGISNYVGGAQKIWNRGIQRRVDATASMLGSMKAVKILGFTDRLADTLQGLRVQELRLSNLFRRLLCIRAFFANSMRLLTPLVTFGFFALLERFTGRQLNAATAYTALSLIALLANPFNTLLRTIPMLISALACFDRIQSFLESSPRHSYSLPLQSQPETGANRKFDGSIELTDLNPIGNNRSNPTLIAVQNASFSWSSNGSPVINDVSFSVSRGSLLFIVGPVGCGKSTLLKGLMNEMPVCKGSVYNNSLGIAFVDQTPWIQNLSIRQNIIGPSSFTKAWYDEVIRACAFDYDISSLPNGDETIVGSRGISLSGGQKQRLAIARALYAKKDLMVIDDGFSGLDAETEEKVFVRLFGKRGLQKKLGTTVVLVTHAVQRLRHANHIVALDSTGHIAEQGSFEQLESAGGYIEGLATKYKSEQPEILFEMDSEMDITSIAQRICTQDIGNSHSEETNLTRKTGELATYKYYFASIGWSRSLLSLSYLVISGVSVKLTELLLTYWTNAIADHDNPSDSFYLGLYGMLAGLGILAFNVGVYHYFLYVVPGSAEELHLRLLRAVMGAPLHFFTSTDTGTTTNRFSQDMSVVDGELPFALIDLIISLVQTIVGTVLMCISAGYFTLTMPPVIFAVWVIQKFYLRTSRQIRILDLEAKSPLYSHFIESLSGLVTIRAFGWSDTFIEMNLNLLDNSQKPYYLLFCIQRWLALVLDLMVSVLAIILMVLVVKLRGSIGPGYVGLALLNVMSFSESLAWIVKQWTGLETSIGAIARVKSFAMLTPNENLASENQPVPEVWPTHGVIELKNVTASYTKSGRPVIENVNMSIRPGEKIGICGRSGSGKSSLIMTLLRLLELHPESSIMIDGIDITTIPRQLVRSRFNAVPQDPFLIKGSIRLNACPGNCHSDTEIIAALGKVRLWPVIESKGGLDAELEVDSFSHGQRQLFCLARAILRKTKVVILDEVSSSIDITTDKLIQRVIREEFAGATIIAIAHRLDTILDFDRVALMSDGELVEFDSPQALLSRPSAFRDLYNS